MCLKLSIWLRCEDLIVCTYASSCVKVSEFDSTVLEDSFKITFGLFSATKQELARFAFLSDPPQAYLISFSVIFVKVSQRLMQESFSCIVDILDCRLLLLSI